MEEEILQEIEAVIAVYGSDCQVLHEFPPHLKVSIKPRTAEDLSQQFVEAVLVIKANTQYPIVPPEVELINLKGLDDKRHLDFLSELQDEAKMLAPSPMLVALCEAAIDRLTNMNHPEGNCSFCLFPLVMEVAQSGSRPFMKLMSCFHCFHSDCFGRWWRWLQEQNQHEQCDSANTIPSEGFGESLDGTAPRPSSEANKVEACDSVNCPVCRKVIRIEDIEHVRQFLQSESNFQEVANSSASERNCSTYSFIHSIKHNRLCSKRVKNIVYVHSNLHLLSHKQNECRHGETKLWDIELEHTDLDASSSQLIAFGDLDSQDEHNISASDSSIHGSSNAPSSSNVNDDDDIFDVADLENPFED